MLHPITDKVVFGNFLKEFFNFNVKYVKRIVFFIYVNHFHFTLRHTAVKLYTIVDLRKKDTGRNTRG